MNALPKAETRDAEQQQQQQQQQQHAAMQAQQQQMLATAAQAQVTANMTPHQMQMQQAILAHQKQAPATFLYACTLCMSR